MIRLIWERLKVWGGIWLITMACLGALVLISEPRKPIRADPQPAAICVVTKKRTWITPDTYVERDGWEGMIPAYPCKLLKKEQDV